MKKQKENIRLTRSKPRIWVRDVFIRREQDDSFYWLVKELKLGLCCKDKVLPPHKNSLSCKDKIFILYISKTEYQAKKACARNILEKIDGFLWSLSAKDFNWARNIKIFQIQYYWRVALFILLISHVPILCFLLWILFILCLSTFLLNKVSLN